MMDRRARTTWSSAAPTRSSRPRKQEAEKLIAEIEQLFPQVERVVGAAATSAATPSARRAASSSKTRAGDRAQGHRRGERADRAARAHAAHVQGGRGEGGMTGFLGHSPEDVIAPTRAHRSDSSAAADVGAARIRGDRRELGRRHRDRQARRSGPRVRSHHRGPVDAARDLRAADDGAGRRGDKKAARQAERGRARRALRTSIRCARRRSTR